MEVRKIKDLVPYEKNPRKNKAAVDRVLESLKLHGQVKPIVLSAKGHPFEQEVICAGHTTMLALKRFGSKEAKVVVVEFENEKSFVDYNIRDNKAGEFADWDETMLSELSAKYDSDLGEMGFDFELPPLAGGNNDPESIPAAPTKPKSKPGCIWELGDHRLMCGDSTNESNIKTLMGDDFANLWITDPPYNLNYEGKTKDALKIENDSMSNDSFRQFLVDCYKAADLLIC